MATLSVESRNCVIKIMTNHVPCQNYYLNLDIKSVHRTCLLYHRISNFEIFLNVFFSNVYVLTHEIDTVLNLWKPCSVLYSCKYFLLNYGLCTGSKIFTVSLYCVAKKGTAIYLGLQNPKSPVRQVTLAPIIFIMSPIIFFTLFWWFCIFAY